MGDLISDRMFRVAQTSIEERCGLLSDKIGQMRKRALQHLMVARNMEHENKKWALHEKQAAHLAMAQVQVYEKQLGMLEMQAAFFAARRSPRLCEISMARFVPPWVVWHLPKPKVWQLVSMCKSMKVRRRANESDKDLQLRSIAEAHEAVLRSINTMSAETHKPPKFVSRADVEFIRRFAIKMRSSKPMVDRAFKKFMQRRLTANATQKN